MAGTDYKHIRVTPNKDGFGARIDGIQDVSAMSPEQLIEVKQAFALHSVICFPDQPLSLQQQEDFTRQFGAFGVDPYIVPMEQHPNILELRREPDEKAPNFGAGWHSDWSFQPEPPAVTILHSKVTPPIGGDTLFCDCYRAYEDLSPVFQTFLDTLTAAHTAALPYGRNGLYAGETGKRSMKIIASEEAEKLFNHPLVRVHPETRRKALFVGPIYTSGIVGMAETESKAVLAFLYDHMLQDRYIYRHKWQPGMVLMWDNRCTLHYADGGYDGHLRVMHRTTVAGEKPLAAS